MLFTFTLAPVEKVTPWKNADGPIIHWFGLTDGEYWIEAGADTLFEYSPYVRERHAFPRFCDYAVARLYDDLIEMVPHILEPVPSSLVPFLRYDGPGRDLQHVVEKMLANSHSLSEVDWDQRINPDAGDAAKRFDRPVKKISNAINSRNQAGDRPRRADVDASIGMRVDCPNPNNHPPRANWNPERGSRVARGKP